VSLARFLFQRVLLTTPLLVVISLSGFLIINAIPGGPLAAYTENPEFRSEDLVKIALQLGLDQPIHVRYVRWLTTFVGGDWGYSYSTKQPVVVMIGERLKNTALLFALAYLTILAVSVPIGILAATKAYSATDYLITGAAFMALSVPTFWLGLLLIIVFSVALRIFPAGGMATIGAEFSLVDRLRHLILPLLTLSFVTSGAYARYVRSEMLEVLGQDYIRTARAKGLPARRVRWQAFRNAAIPFVTVAVMYIPELMTGTVVVETIFSWPGMGRLLWEAALRHDYPVLMGILVVGATATLFASLLADILYAWLDPRIRY